MSLIPLPDLRFKLIQKINVGTGSFLSSIYLEDSYYLRTEVRLSLWNSMEWFFDEETHYPINEES